MKTEMECIKCFCDSLFHQLGKLELSPEAKTATAREVMRRISEADFDLPPPLIAAQVNQVISAAAGESSHSGNSNKTVTFSFRRRRRNRPLPEGKGTFHTVCA